MGRHIAIFPFMAQGHTLPLIDLSKALSSRYNIGVTIITTPSNSNSIRAKLSDRYPNITLAELPFPTIHGLPLGCENTSQLPSISLYPNFLLATKDLRKPFSDLLREMRDSKNSLPLCVISDFFLAFTLQVCRDFGVPRLVFHGMGALPMAICKASWGQKRYLMNVDDPQQVIDFSGVLELPFAVRRSDLPTFPTSDDDEMTRLTEEAGETDINSWGVVVNSFVEAELGKVPCFESFYNGGARAWCVGPLNLLDDSEPSDPEEIGTVIERWLGDRGPTSVIYVSFGSQSEVSGAQLDELAYGLEEAGKPFLWVIGSKTKAWSPPEDIKESLNDKGLIVSEWVDQRRILAHVAVGGFLSHCGWNSVMESLSAGVPILAWPLFADQGVNARLVVDGLGAGTGIENLTTNNNNNNGVVSRGVVYKGVRDLMGPTKEGRRVRENAAELRGVARRAIGDGGSSWKTLNELVDKLLQLGLSVS